MTDLRDFSDAKLARLFRFVMRAKWDPPIDEKAFTPEANALLDHIGQLFRDRPESLVRKSVVGTFGLPIDRINLGMMIVGARHEWLGREKTISLRAAIEIGIHPYVLDEEGVSMVESQADFIGWPDPAASVSEVDR